MAGLGTMRGGRGGGVRCGFGMGRAGVMGRVMASVVLLSGLLMGQSAPGDGGLVTSAGQVHSLTEAEARRARPVRFRGVVLFSDAPSSSLFVGDRTGGIYLAASVETMLKVREGTSVEVTGVTAAGDFAPLVRFAQLRILGQTAKPGRAAEVTAAEMATGIYDCRWVEVKGLVRAVSWVGHMVSLRIATRDGVVVALVPNRPGENYERLVDATVRVRGVAAVEYNKRRQMTGSHLFTSSLEEVRVLHSNGSDPFGLRVSSISQLAEFDPKAKVTDRIHLRGRVTLHWPGHRMCLEDGTGGLCVSSPLAEAYREGSVVDVVGYPVFAAQIPTVADARIRRSDLGSEGAVKASDVGAKALLEGGDSGRLVSVEGELVGLSSDARFVRLTIASQQMVFNAVLPREDRAAKGTDWEVGSWVRLVGVCEDEVDARIGQDWTSAQINDSFEVMLRSSADVVVLRKPSWWTPAHENATLAGGVAVTLAVFGWVLLLRRQVGQRTRELGESERRYRHLAHHDSLTGIPNRAWFHERAERSLDLARQGGRSLGLLLLDLDHFKPVNDTLGHEAGDRMLCVLAERVSAVLRRADTVARLGGDEFAVVLVEVADDADAEVVAEKILRAVCQPVTIEGHEIAMSASIGVAVFPEDGSSVTELLRSADLAMYESKKLARGGIRRFRREVTLAEVEGMAEIAALV
jgi:diguanylate cyclase (GGDEF)-like protein